MRQTKKQIAISTQKTRISRFSPKEQSFKEFIQKYSVFIGGQTQKLVRNGVEEDEARQVVLEIIWDAISHPKYNPLAKYASAWIFQRVTLHVISACKAKKHRFFASDDVLESWGAGDDTLDSGVWGQRFPDTEKRVFARIALQKIDQQAQQMPEAPRQVLTALIRETGDLVEHAQGRPSNPSAHFYEVAGTKDLADYLGIGIYAVSRRIKAARSLLLGETIAPEDIDDTGDDMGSDFANELPHISA